VEGSVARSRKPGGQPLSLFVLAALSAFLSVAGTASARGDRRAPAHLRETGLYSDWEHKLVAQDVLTYSPQYPLWSDGAQKRRWIRLPRGKWINAANPDVWSFPVGTQFWKEFQFDRRVETRYMRLLADGSWLFAAYFWNEDGTEAVLAPVGGINECHSITSGVRHNIPSVADCRACHEGGASPVLGFTALQLSPDRDQLAPNAEPLQRDEVGYVELGELIRLRLVRRLPVRFLQTAPRIHAPTPNARAVLGYLNANCGNCHNESGPLSTLGMSLAYRLVTAEAGQTPAAVRTTVGVPVFTGAMGGGEQPLQRIASGQPDRSAIVQRMSSRHPVRQMPPLGTKVVDAKALELLNQWIAVDLSHPKSNNQENTP
jgi:hypothetical protein